jgi:hypothetical protein
MFEVSGAKISGRVIRNGQEEPRDDGWLDSSPEERIEAVWTLTELCLAWNNHSADEPRLQRTITRVERSRR